MAAGTLSGWGHAPVVAGREVRSEDLANITRGLPLTRGLGRAYGDAALPRVGDTVIAGSALADRILSFDSETGVLQAEAGFSLDDLYRVFLPRGYFVPVTPGTRFVTLGGMVAADVHGKNHHVDGTIGRHVISLTLRLADGLIVTCSPDRYTHLFRATIGGMGLTGHILDVTLRLVRVSSPWIVQETERIRHIDDLVAALRAAAAIWPMTVGWVDCVTGGTELGRGILYKGRWALHDEAPRTFPHLRAPVSVPFVVPGGLMRPVTVRAFNRLKHRIHRDRPVRRVVHPASFFYPLDRLGNWYRLYGRAGFAQYQCVLPDTAPPGSIRRLLEIVAASENASPLCVIKDCGPEGEGLLSFPMRGTSVALDLPMRRDTSALIDRLNEVVVAEGGRIYLAKDALTRREHFEAMEPRLPEFLRVRRQWDPDGRIRSAQSVRLFGW